MFNSIRRVLITVLGIVTYLGFAEACAQSLTGNETRCEGGIQSFRIPSPFQAAETTLRVLTPDELDRRTAYRVLYVLPVDRDEVKQQRLLQRGDGLVEIQRLGLHNQFQLICVTPGFTSQPWYADHDQNPEKRDESHFLKTVIPFVEERFPAQADTRGRLLVGYSKSGRGAMTLLLRHPDIFHRAAAWDPGIRIDTGPMDAAERATRIRRDFGSPKNFDAYSLTKLIAKSGRDLGRESRLFYFNTEGPRALGGVEIHRLLVESQVPHRYTMEPRRAHRWNSGWIPDAIAFLVKE